MNTVVWSIAGYDPCGGAGLLADQKVFLAHGLNMHGVCTALTVQNETEFVAPGWVPWKSIAAQLTVLSRQSVPTHVKIGLVENPRVLARIVQWLRVAAPQAFVLWDPILKASAGFAFHGKAAGPGFARVLPQIDLLTPNLPEARELAAMLVRPERGSSRVASKGTADDAPAGQWLAAEFALDVLVKGGHASGTQSTDVLYELGGVAPTLFSARRLQVAARHGSGCTLSSSILAHLALGQELPQAIGSAKKAVRGWLRSGVYRGEDPRG